MPCARDTAPARAASARILVETHRADCPSLILPLLSSAADHANVGGDASTIDDEARTRTADVHNEGPRYSGGRKPTSISEMDSIKGRTGQPVSLTIHRIADRP